MAGPLADVRPDERRIAWSAFLTLFGMLAGHTVLETARDALFLARLPEGSAKPESSEPKSTPPPKSAQAKKPKANAPAQNEDDAILQSMKDKYKRRTNK